MPSRGSPRRKAAFRNFPPRPAESQEADFLPLLRRCTGRLGYRLGAACPSRAEHNRKPTAEAFSALDHASSTGILSGAAACDCLSPLRVVRGELLDANATQRERLEDFDIDALGEAGLCDRSRLRESQFVPNSPFAGAVRLCCSALHRRQLLGVQQLPEPRVRRSTVSKSISGKSR